MEPMQEATQPPRRRPGNPAFVLGNRVNPAGRPTKAERQVCIEAKLAALAEPFGGTAVLPSIELERLRLAAELLTRRPPRADDRVRCVNAADRLIRQVERRVGRGRPPMPVAGRGPAVDDLLRRRDVR
jgi:hypothetical protein